MISKSISILVICKFVATKSASTNQIIPQELSKEATQNFGQTSVPQFKETDFEESSIPISNNIQRGRQILQNPNEFGNNMLSQKQYLDNRLGGLDNLPNSKERFIENSPFNDFVSQSNEYRETPQDLLNRKRFLVGNDLPYRYKNSQNLEYSRANGIRRGSGRRSIPWQYYNNMYQRYYNNDNYKGSSFNGYSNFYPMGENYSNYEQLNGADNIANVRDISF